MDRTLHCTVIIVTYNNANEIVHCLKSLQLQDSTPAPQIIVVDNASSDDTAKIVSREFPEATLIRNEYNRGFAAANNDAFAVAKGEHLFLFNPDARADSDCVRLLCDYLDEHNGIGCVGPEICDESRRQIISFNAFTSVWMSLWTAAGLQRLIPLNRIAGKLTVAARVPRLPVSVDRLLGAAMMIKREALLQVGQFDERFFLYSEEEDLCRRFHGAGWKVVFCPQAHVTHIGGVSMGESALPVASATWSRHLYMQKYSSPVAVRLSRAVWIVGLFLRLCGVSLLFLMGRRTIVAGYWEALKSLLITGYFDRVLRPKPVSQ